MSEMLWHWRVEYDDGSYFNEFDEEGRDHGWAEADHSRVRHIILVPKSKSVAMHAVVIPEGVTPYFTRRHRILLDQEHQEQITDTTYLLGWQHGVLASYLYVFANGATILSSDEFLI